MPPTACQVKIAHYVANLVPSTGTEKASALWRAGLLTGLPTHIANTLGNATMQGLEIAKSPIASAADRVLAGRSGTRTRMFSMRDVRVGSREGAAAGVERAKRIMAGMPVEDAYGKAWEALREVNFDNPYIDAYVKFVFRTLNAEDAIPRMMALHRSLQEQARIMASSTRLLPGETIEGRMAEILRVPTDDMMRQSTHDAEVATFADRTPLGEAAAGLKRGIESGGVIGKAASTLSMPFTRTPAAVATRAAEYTPLGLALAGKDMARWWAETSQADSMSRKAAELFGLATNGDATEVTRLQRRAVDRLGRAAVGTLPIIAGYLLTEHGYMTPAFPADQKTRNEWQLAGKQENSVNIGGTWHKVDRLSPLGNLMSFGAYLSYARDEYAADHGAPGTLADEAKMALGTGVATAASIGTTLSQQSFLQGIKNAQDAMADPAHKGEGWLQQTIGSVVPAFVARAAGVVDPVQRETKDSLLGSLQSRLPGMSSSLPARVDQLGAPLEKSGGGLGGFVSNFLDPTSPRPDRSGISDVHRELTRLGYAPSRLTRDTKNGETAEEFYARREKDGIELRRELSAALASDAYQNIAKETRWLYQTAPEVFAIPTRPGVPARQRSVDDIIREQQLEYVRGIVQSVRSSQRQLRSVAPEAAGAVP